MSGQVDTREWRMAAAELWATSRRELPDFLNGQAFKVCVEAIRLTARSNRATVERELGQVATNVRKSTSRKTGKTTFRARGRVVLDHSLAARILTKRFRLTGEWGLKGKTLEDRATKLIAARVRAISFIRSGWIGALRALESRVFKKPRTKRIDRSAKTYGVTKGGAWPAVGSQRMDLRTTIFNTALNTEPLPPSGKGAPLRPAAQGLAAALRSATADMRAEFERRLASTFRKASTK